MYVCGGGEVKRKGGGYVGGGKKKKRELGEGENIQREQREGKEENEKGKYFRSCEKNK